MANGVSVQDVYDYVQEKIINKIYFPGNRITEEELANELNTSRTTVRSAISKLHNDGFIEIIPNKGSYVSKPTVQDMYHVYEIRKILELEAIKRAIPRIDAENIANMEKCIEEQIAIDEDFHMSRYVDINRRFHWEIIKAADNVYLEKFLSELFNKVAIFLVFYDRSVSNAGSIKTHRDILNAIKAGDEAAARKAIEEDSFLAITWVEI